MRFVIRRWTGLALIGAAAALAAQVAPAAASASISALTSPVVGHVYVNDNTAGTKCATQLVVQACDLSLLFCAFHERLPIRAKGGRRAASRAKRVSE